MAQKRRGVRLTAFMLTFVLLFSSIAGIAMTTYGSQNLYQTTGKEEDNNQAGIAGDTNEEQNIATDSNAAGNISPSPGKKEYENVTNEAELREALMNQQDTIELSGVINLSGPLVIDYSVILSGGTLRASAKNDRLLKINAIGGDVTLEDITFDGRSVAGGIAIFSGNVTVDSCVFYDCGADKGGAIYANNQYDTLWVSNSEFFDCIAFAYGGAIYSACSNLYVGDCVFVQCSAGGEGGGICMEKTSAGYYDISPDTNEFYSCTSGSTGNTVSGANRGVYYEDLGSYPGSYPNRNKSFSITFDTTDGGYLTDSNGQKREVPFVIEDIADGTLWGDLFSDGQGNEIPEPVAEENYYFSQWSPELPEADFPITSDATYTAEFADKMQGLKVGARPVRVIYDGEAHSIKAKSNQTDAVIWYMDENGHYTLTTAPEFVDAGSHKVEFMATHPRYAAVKGSSTIYIKEKPLQIIAEDKRIAEGDELPELTYIIEGLAARDTKEVLNPEPQLTTLYTNSSRAGNYDITITRNVQTDNYEITYIDGNLTVVERHTITFDGNGGIQVNDSEQKISLESGATEISLENAPKYELSRHRFLGWSEDKTAVTAEYSEAGIYNGPLEKDVTLYAVWEFIGPVTVQFIARENGSLISRDSQQQTSVVVIDDIPLETTWGALFAADGSAYSLPEPVADDGYFFSGWTPGLPDAGKGMTEDLIFTAQFKAKTEGMMVAAEDIIIEYDGFAHQVQAYSDKEDAVIRYMDEDGRYTLSEAPEFVAAGRYVVKFKASHDTKADAYGSATVTIHKKPLYIIANHYWMIEGDMIPELQYRVVGLAENDTNQVLSNLPQLTTTYKADSGIGKYLITITKDLQADNYQIRYIDGNLTVTKYQRITFNGNGGITANEENQQLEILRGQTGISLAAAPGYELSRHKLIGWSENKNAATPEYEVNGFYRGPLEADITLYAVWEFVGPVTVQFTVQGNGSLNGQDDGVGTTVVTFDDISLGTTWGDLFAADMPGYFIPEPVADTGYFFQGWTPEFPDNENEIMKDLTFAARFKEKTAGLTVSADNIAVEYDGLAHQVQAFTNQSDGIIWYMDENGEYSLLEAPEFVAAGSYEVQFLAAHDTLADAYGTATVTIWKKALQIIADDEWMIEGDVLPEFSYQIVGFIAGEDDQVLSNPPQLSTSYNPDKGIGEYDISIKKDIRADNYRIRYTNGTLTVTKYHTITFDGNGGISGDGRDQQISILRGETNISLTAAPEYELSRHKLLGWSESPGAVTPEYEVGDVYRGPLEADIILYAVWEFIGPVTIEFIAQENGKLIHPANQMATASVLIEDVPLGISWGDLFNAGINGYSIPEPAADDGYFFRGWTPALPDDGKGIREDMIFAARFQEKTNGLMVEADNIFVEYDGFSHQVQAFSDEQDGTILYMDEAGDYTLFEAPKFVNAGNYEVQFKATHDTLADAYGMATVTIRKKPLEITADDKWMIEGDELPELSYQIFGLVEGEDDQVLSNLPRLSTSYKPNKGIGEYDIFITKDIQADNYRIRYINGKLTVTKYHTITFDGNGGIPTDDKDQQLKILRGETNISLSAAPGYELSRYKLLGWSEDKNALLPEYAVNDSYQTSLERDITLYAVWEFVGPVSLTFSVSGNGSLADRNGVLQSSVLIEDIELGTLWGDLFNPLARSGFALRPVAHDGYFFSGWSPEWPVGSMPIRDDLAFTAEFTAKPDQMVVVANDISVEYDGFGHTIQAVSSEAEATILYRDTEGNYTLSKAPEFVNSGRYEVQFVALHETIADAYGKATITIEKKDLTITAGNETITSGQTIPEFQYTIDGFIDGEDEDLLSGDLQLSTNYTGTGIGEYDIIITADLTAENYNVHYINGTLTVNRSATDGGGSGNGSENPPPEPPAPTEPEEPEESAPPEEETEEPTEEQELPTESLPVSTSSNAGGSSSGGSSRYTFRYDEERQAYLVIDEDGVPLGYYPSPELFLESLEAVPKTGDTSALSIRILLLLLSAGAIALLLDRKQHKTRRQK